MLMMMNYYFTQYFMVVQPYIIFQISQWNTKGDLSYNENKWLFILPSSKKIKIKKHYKVSIGIL